MNREILFRGKHIHVLPGNEHLNGRWIEGYLSSKDYINSPELKGEFLIDENTICEYTGLTDKNGRKIFEKDVVSGLFDGEQIRGFIKYGSNAMYYIERDGLYGILLDNAQDWLEVIGNILDNPELLD